ncbi:MAG: zinc ABC transporter substrate-binding protein [Anaerolineales bacterium]|nr:zinc ABC transporter substrate-binding protein [Anaerolineales bacterium]
MFSKKLIPIALLIWGSLLLVACGPAQAGQAEAEPGDEDHAGQVQNAAAMDLVPIELAAGEKLQMVATTNIIGDMVQNVAGDLIELNILMPLGSDPHTFQPAPQDIALVADADVVFANGLDYEAFLDELITNAGGDAVVVRVTNGVETREFGEGGQEHDGNDHGHDEAATEHHEEAEEHQEPSDDHEQAHHVHSGADPHAWMTPHNALVYVHNIEAALSALDPAQAETYQAQAEAYEAQLEALDQWVFEQIETIPPENRELVTDHEGFGYYADRYGLNIVGAVIPSYSTAAEPSAQEMADLEKAISVFNAPAIFVNSTVNLDLAERVAGDTGTKLVPLYTESLGPASSGAETYLDSIRYNTTAIVDALK